MVPAEAGGCRQEMAPRYISDIDWLIGSEKNKNNLDIFMPEAFWSNKIQLFRDHMLAPDSDKTVSPKM